MVSRLTRLLVVADTHAPRRWKSLPPRLVPLLEGADLVLHAGDVCVPAVLDELSAFAPVRVVLGNNDGPEVAAWGGGVPETLSLEVDGVRLAMIHDAGPRQGRGRRMRRRFPEADVVVYGHSHIPMDLVEDGTHLFNPGSPTDKRRQPRHTAGILEIAAGELVRHEIVAL
ncbi:metallophosphoesterase family protein [uncultured Arsenicicoccus sp.]|uniref:metallophosphoesterase family protein n=1 Tax=uncultured Arsenicicoccus sp. TaxID=491339 RepID=UPI002591697B|nr:metallophosphoesterase family protein [uncultured Arsenicicoccus sp.]